MGVVLHHAVIVAGDRARADIGFGADGRVADIAQVVHLGPFGDLRVLDLDKVANAHLLGQLCTGARAAGVPCVLVSFGPSGDDMAALGPEALLDHYDDLPDIVTRLIGAV